MRMDETHHMITLKITGYLLAAVMIGLFIVAGPPATASRGDRLAARLKQGVFLFAVPEMRDPNFVHTVVLLVNYEEGGAMGLIINKPTDIPLEEALPDVKEMKGQSQPLFLGGPVSRNLMFMLLRSNQPPKGAVKVFDGVQFSGGRKALVEALQDRDPNKKVRVYAGYAGWAAGQLDREVSRGGWMIANADPEKIFTNDPSKIWPEVFKIQEEIEIRGLRSNPSPSRAPIPAILTRVVPGDGG